jgi:rRNA maturation endonuclease Nob1
VTPTKQGNRKKIQSPDVSDQTPAEKRASRTWAKRLKRVFDIDIETCEKCGGNVKIIASIRLQGCRR